MDGPVSVLRALHDHSSVAAALTGVLAGDALLALWREGASAYVLTDLSAPLGDDTVGMALCGPVDESGDAALLGFLVRPGWPVALRRLLDGVANTVRASGARRLVASVEPVGVLRPAALHAAGFRRDDERAGDGRRVVREL